MFMFSRLLFRISLAIAVSAAVTKVGPLSTKGTLSNPHHTDPLTDFNTIFNTVGSVKQKGGANGKPNQPPQKTIVTATDGRLTAAGTNGETAIQRRRSEGLVRRVITNDYNVDADYTLVFSGTGTRPNDRDAAVEGTAYLTYITVDSNIYDVNDCLELCSGIPDCVFVNLYYEYNNPDLHPWNLICAIFADVYTAAAKTNFGGQQLAPPPAGLTYIQDSSGYAANTLVEPDVPPGYELVFGPTGGANNAPGYMGFALLDFYDVDACAEQCNTRGADPNGGACQYFNIWRAVVNGNPTTYTCAMYYIPTDASTAVNTGQGDLVVTYSRGYKRIDFLVDGGFEGFGCANDYYCYTTSYANWIGTSPPGGYEDAGIFYYVPYAHTGHGSGLLGNGIADPHPGTLNPSQPLQTVAGKQYQITFFQNSAYSDATDEAPSYINVMWNGQTVQTFYPGYQNWQLYQVTVTAGGNDILGFNGGLAPAWVFLDDITVFQL